DTDLLDGIAANFFGDGVEILKKWLDETIELVAYWSEEKRTALKQTDAEVGLEREELGAYGGLLNAVGHVAHGFHNSAKTRHKIKQFKVVNIHASKGLWPIFGQIVELGERFSTIDEFDRQIDPRSERFDFTRDKESGGAI